LLSAFLLRRAFRWADCWQDELGNKPSYLPSRVGGPLSAENAGAGAPQAAYDGALHAGHVYGDALHSAELAW